MPTKKQLQFELDKALTRIDELLDELDVHYGWATVAGDVIPPSPAEERKAKKRFKEWLAKDPYWVDGEYVVEVNGHKFYPMGSMVIKAGEFTIEDHRAISGKFDDPYLMIYQNPTVRICDHVPPVLNSEWREA